MPDLLDRVAASVTPLPQPANQIPASQGDLLDRVAGASGISPETTRLLQQQQASSDFMRQNWSGPEANQGALSELATDVADNRAEAAKKLYGLGMGIASLPFTIPPAAAAAVGPQTPEARRAWAKQHPTAETIESIGESGAKILPLIVGAGAGLKAEGLVRKVIGAIFGIPAAIDLPEQARESGRISADRSATTGEKILSDADLAAQFGIAGAGLSGAALPTRAPEFIGPRPQGSLLNMPEGAKPLQGPALEPTPGEVETGIPSKGPPEMAKVTEYSLQSPKAPKVTVPETPADPEREVNVLEEIRQKNLQTTAQIQKNFPAAQLSREQAAELRRQAWGQTKPTETPPAAPATKSEVTRPAATTADILGRPPEQKIDMGIKVPGKEPDASRVTGAASVPQPEVRPRVGQETPLRQQGPPAEAQAPSPAVQERQGGAVPAQVAPPEAAVAPPPAQPAAGEKPMKQAKVVPPKALPPPEPIPPAPETPKPLPPEKVPPVSGEGKGPEHPPATAPPAPGVEQKQSVRDILNEIGPKKKGKGAAAKPTDLASKIRSFKSEPGKLYGGIEGIATAVWDGALEAAARAVETGKSVAEAIEAAIAHIRENHPGEVNEDEVRSKLLALLNEK